MAQIPNSVQVTGFIAPTDTEDTYPTHDSVYGKGGHREVLTLAERNAIPDERRRIGMICYVESEEKRYELIGGIDNLNWSEMPNFGPTVGPLLINVSWNKILNAPVSTVGDIDLAVLQRHTHTNKNILDHIEVPLTEELKDIYDNKVGLDINNKIDNIKLYPHTMIVDTIADRNSLLSHPHFKEKLRVHVKDASGDPTVFQGSAEYIYIDGDWLKLHSSSFKIFTTSSRPTSNRYIGMQIYDSSLKIPIWWDGSNWTNSMGQIV